MKLIYKNLFISVIIMCVLASPILLFQSGSNGNLGKSFNYYVWAQFARYGGLIYGGIALLFAVVSNFRHYSLYRSNLFYAFPGVLNLFVGAGALAIFAFSTKNNQILHDFLPNLLIGVLIVGDIGVGEGG